MHEYLKRIFAARAAGNLPNGAVYDTQVAHDDWCGIYNRRECNCNPDITFITSDGGGGKILADGSIERKQ